MGLRPWEHFALGLAIEAARNSEDPYVKVGACSLKNNNKVGSVGYNGPPSKVEIDWSDRDARRLRVIHAEINALKDMREGECYLLATTVLPCNDCLKYAASKGIKKIFYLKEYERDTTSHQLAKEFGIELIKVDEIEKNGEVIKK